MSIKVRIFTNDVTGLEIASDPALTYFFASYDSGRPTRSELDRFLRICPLHFSIQDYDECTGIGLAEVVWPLANNSGDLELSACPNTDNLTVNSLPNPQEPQFNLNISAFYDLLESHDWYFSFAEDSGDYQSGLRDLVVLDYQARRGGDLFMSLMNEYRSYMFSGDRWSTAQLPKPGRPEGMGYMDAVLAALSKDDFDSRSQLQQPLIDFNDGIRH